MQRPSGIVLACAFAAWSLSSLPAQAQDAGAQPAQQSAQPAPQQAAQAPQKLTFTGDTVLWAFTVHADKSAEYDKVLAKLKESLQKLGTPEAQAQMAGWKVLRNATPQPDGSLLYIHVLNPVVKDADYSISNIVFAAFQEYADRQAFFETYKSAVKEAFFLIQGPVVADMSK
jgi:hypothetical protein